MDVVSYLGHRVHVTLLNGFYYLGLVISADEKSISLIDKNGKRVSLVVEALESIREVE